MGLSQRRSVSESRGTVGRRSSLGVTLGLTEAAVRGHTASQGMGLSTGTLQDKVGFALHAQGDDSNDDEVGNGVLGGDYGDNDEPPASSISETFDSYFSPPGVLPPRGWETGVMPPPPLRPPPPEQLEVEFDGVWYAAEQEVENPWSTTFRFEDGSTAQVPTSHLPFRIRPRGQGPVASAQQPPAGSGRKAVGFNGGAAVPSHLRYVREDPRVRRAKFEALQAHKAARRQREEAAAGGSSQHLSPVDSGPETPIPMPSSGGYRL